MIVYEQYIFSNFTFIKKTTLKLFFIYILYLSLISSDHYLAYKHKLFL